MSVCVVCLCTCINLLKKILQPQMTKKVLKVCKHSLAQQLKGNLKMEKAIPGKDYMTWSLNSGRAVAKTLSYLYFPLLHSIPFTKSKI